MLRSSMVLRCSGGRPPAPLRAAPKLLRLGGTTALLALVLAGCAGPRSAPPSGADFTPDTALRLCRGMTVRNAPAADASGLIRAYSPFVAPAPGVAVLTSPTTGACLTSGFGPRNGRKHKGIDLQAKPAPMIVAGGPGVVREVRRYRGFGETVLIDHGEGVFTRYAHLGAIRPEIATGVQVEMGTPLARMGRSGGVPLHLHYEMLIGDMSGPRKSFDLRPLDPFALPPAQAEAVRIAAETQWPRRDQGRGRDG